MNIKSGTLKSVELHENYAELTTDESSIMINDPLELEQLMRWVEMAMQTNASVKGYVEWNIQKYWRSK